MSAFGTDPDNPNVKPRLVGDFDFAEAFTNSLVEKGIPFYYARIASIDLKHLWIPMWRNKMTPDRAAHMLLADVKKTYNLTDEQLPETDTEV